MDISMLDRQSTARSIQNGALARMSDAAAKLNAQGAGAVLIRPSTLRLQLTPSVSIIGVPLKIDDSDGEDETVGYNVFSIVMSKIGEMIVNKQNSGPDGGNVKVHGHFNWKGGIYYEQDGYEFFIAFSGSTQEIDLKVAEAGLKYIKSQIACMEE